MGLPVSRELDHAGSIGIHDGDLRVEAPSRTAEDLTEENLILESCTALDLETDGPVLGGGQRNLLNASAHYDTGIGYVSDTDPMVARRKRRDESRVCG